jgi:hypothetical protein
MALRSDTALLLPSNFFSKTISNPRNGPSCIRTARNHRAAVSLAHRIFDAQVAVHEFDMSTAPFVEGKLDQLLNRATSQYPLREIQPHI